MHKDLKKFFFTISAFLVFDDERNVVRGHIIDCMSQITTGLCMPPVAEDNSPELQGIIITK